MPAAAVPVPAAATPAPARASAEEVQGGEDGRGRRDTRSPVEEPCSDTPAPAESGEGAKTHATAAHITNQEVDLEHHAPPTLQDSPMLPPPPTNLPASAGSKTITFSSDDEGKSPSSASLRSLGAKENLPP